MNKFLIGCSLFAVLLSPLAFAYTETSGPVFLQPRDTYQITVLNFTEIKFPHYTDYQAKVIGPVPQMTIRVSNFAPTKMAAGKTYLVERAENNWLVVKEVE